MAKFSYKNEIIDNYVSEITSRIVLETGIPSDKYHLGKIILQRIKDDPDFVMQIDGGTGESETNKSMLRRSIQCATSFKNMGLRTGDVIVLMAPNHLDQAVPFYAALYLGIAIAPIDRTLVVDELKDTLDISKPKIIFCQSEKVQDVQKAVEFLSLDSKIISFDGSPYTMSFSEMMEEHGGQVEVENFKPADFNSEETIAFLISTSGTTGMPKCAALSHKNMAISGPYTCSFATKVPFTRSSLLLPPLRWLTAIVQYVMSVYLKYTRIQSSLPLTTEHILELIRKYKPTLATLSPPMMTTLMKAVKQENCDLSCLEVLYLGGSAVSETLLDECRSWTPNTRVVDIYGISEMGSIALYSMDSPIGSCGKPYSHYQYKLVKEETEEEIIEANDPGELWIKPPGGFKGYYNKPEATAEVLTKDGWFKTGDMFYRDEDWNFYFVERIKLLFKYKSQKVSPLEIEGVIRQHPGVLDVAVTSLYHVECGDLPVACVVPVPGSDVTAEEIKDLVKEKLTDSKQLRGGVFFLKELPLTTSTKVHRRKLKQFVMEMTTRQNGM